MGKSVSKGSKYSAQQKADVAIQYAVSGNMKRVAKQSGIPRTTILSWRKQEWWDELIEEIRGEKSEEHIAKYNQIVDLSQDKTIELIPKIKSAREASLVVCMSQDKSLLLQGRPTSISGQSGGTQALIKKFNDLADKWDEKQAKVVKTQDETEEIDQD